MKANHSPSRGIVRSPVMVTGSRGRIGVTRMAVMSSNRLSMRLMKTMMRPILATTFANAGAFRNGLNTSA